MTNHLHDALVADRAGDDRTFLHFADGTTWSYRHTIALSARMATVLVEHGAAPGDRVVVQVEKSPEALALYLACVRSGVILVPLNPAYTAAEVAYFVEDAEPAVVVAGDAVRLSTLVDEAESAPEMAPVPRTSEDLAAILYTSGTTGRSKGAMLSHGNLLSNALALADGWQFTDADVLLHALPIFHTHGLFVAVNISLAAGGSMIFLPRFDADEVIRLLPRATALMGVPTFYTRLLAHPGFSSEVTARMRLFVSGSAPLLAETHATFADRTGLRILERYGMTETSMIASNPCDGERRAGTVGFALPDVDVRVCVPESGAPVAVGEVGVIEVKGPNVFSGYWQMPDRTAEEFRPDGFFITGDLGRVDPDGYLEIVGRGKDLIISGGLNVYPKEVETTIDAIEGVVESAVIGVPHGDLGEAVVAVVVGDGTVVTEDRITSALAGRLARFKQPKRVVLVDELPRNTMGKVQKSVLRDRFG